MRITRAKHITGTLRAWVCTAQTGRAGGPAACSRKLTINGQTGQVRLPATMTGKLRVIVIRQRH